MDGSAASSAESATPSPSPTPTLPANSRTASPLRSPPTQLTSKVPWESLTDPMSTGARTTRWRLSTPTLSGHSPSLHLRVEELLKNYGNVCTLRVLMPILSDLSNPRNFITKITSHERVVKHPELNANPGRAPPNLNRDGKEEPHGATNLGLVNHNEILEMYKECIPAGFTWKTSPLRSR
ncbi:hypothetical protein MLD38_027807 [Melastoma candidum]|uniref:Uncharacterized protein n=1 Tax=Melastoma candidum TaxID=119954 RepID=A0ACB9P8L1_9MYRT|nr:hypothetical protein MLD38_027807 [Melastoma candidum]